MSTPFLTIDERLLAGQLREEKRKEKNEKQIITKEDIKSPNEKEGPTSLREVVLMSRSKQTKQKLKKQKNIANNNVTQLASCRALRWAWMALIPSWGLSLIYINAHAFLSVIFPNIVCKLGEEWLPPQVRGRASSGLSYLEWTGLAVLDFIVFCIIMFIVALLGAIIRFLDSSVVGKIILKLLS